MGAAVDEDNLLAIPDQVSNIGAEHINAYPLRATDFDYDHRLTPSRYWVFGDQVISDQGIRTVIP